MQQINLYLDEFKQKRVPFSAETFVFIFFGSIMFCFLATAVVYIMYVSAAAHIKTAERDLEKMQTAFDLAQNEFQIIELDPRLQVRIDAMQKRVSENQRLLKFLDKRNLHHHQQSFAGMLQALTQVQEQGLWLKEIRFESSGDGLSLSGFALYPESVPAYLTKLGKHPAFRGMQFKVFDLKRDKEQLAFTLSSKRKESEPNEALLEVLGETVQPAKAQ